MPYITDAAKEYAKKMNDAGFGTATYKKLSTSSEPGWCFFKINDLQKFRAIIGFYENVSKIYQLKDRPDYYAYRKKDGLDDMKWLSVAKALDIVSDVDKR